MAVKKYTKAKAFKKNNPTIILVTIIISLGYKTNYFTYKTYCEEKMAFEFLNFPRGTVHLPNILHSWVTKKNEMHKKNEARLCQRNC